jgi:hypothetical protein
MADFLGKSQSSEPNIQASPQFDWSTSLLTAQIATFKGDSGWNSVLYDSWFVSSPQVSGLRKKVVGPCRGATRMDVRIFRELMLEAHKGEIIARLDDWLVVGGHNLNLCCQRPSTDLTYQQSTTRWIVSVEPAERKQSTIGTYTSLAGMEVEQKRKGWLTSFTEKRDVSEFLRNQFIEFNNHLPLSNLDYR